MPGSPIYQSNDAQDAVSNFLKHPSVLSFSSPSQLFPNAPIPQSTWESFTRAELQRVDEGSIAPQTLLAHLDYLRAIHVENLGVDPTYLRSPIVFLANGNSVKPPRPKKADDKGMNAKGLKHLVKYALSREWINDSNQWKAMFPMSQSQVSSYIRSVPGSSVKSINTMKQYLRSIHKLQGDHGGEQGVFGSKETNEVIAEVSEILSARAKQVESTDLQPKLRYTCEEEVEEIEEEQVVYIPARLFLQPYDDDVEECIISCIGVLEYQNRAQRARFAAAGQMLDHGCTEEEIECVMILAQM